MVMGVPPTLLSALVVLTITAVAAGCASWPPATMPCRAGHPRHRIRSGSPRAAWRRPALLLGDGVSATGQGRWRGGEPM